MEVGYWSFPSYHPDKTLFPYKLIEFLRHLSASALPSPLGVWVSGRFVSLKTRATLHLMSLWKRHRIKNPDHHFMMLHEKRAHWGGTLDPCIWKKKVRKCQAGKNVEVFNDRESTARWTENQYPSLKWTPFYIKRLLPSPGSFQVAVMIKCQRVYFYIGYQVGGGTKKPNLSTLT